MFGKRKPKPTATEISEYVQHLGVDHPGWLAWYYFDHPDRFPNPVADNLARDCRMEPLSYVCVDAGTSLPAR